MRFSRLVGLRSGNSLNQEAPNPTKDRVWVCTIAPCRLGWLVSIVQSGLHDGCTMACTLHDLRRAKCNHPL